MRSILVCVFTIALCAFDDLPIAAWHAQAPARDESVAKAVAVIRGRVLAAESGRPLGKAHVRLTGQELRDGRTVRTDAEGRYEFANLPPGRFQLTASKAGYAQLQYGQLRAFESGKPLDIGAGQSAEKIDFSLPRGGVIAGRVLDELGDPAVDVSVVAARYQFVNGRRRLLPVGRPAVTNDIGEFRVYGLLPGSYYVSAAARESLFETLMNAGAPTGGDTQSGYAPTYYPGTDRLDAAQRLIVKAGQTITEIQIPLSLTRTARIAGVVRDSEGRAVSQGAVMAMQKDTPSIPFMSQLHSDGSFTLNGVSPGDYTVVSATGSPMTGGEVAFTTVAVSGDDVTGVQLNASKAITVTGRILPVSTPQRPLPVSELSVAIVAANPEMAIAGSPRPTKIKEDQTFEIKAMPGHVVFRLGGTTGAWEIHSVRRRGEDITDTGIEFVPNEDVSGLEIELTDQPTGLSGTVSGKSQALRDYAVVAFATDPERWTPTSRAIRVGRPDQAGKFRVSIPAGEYFVAALDYLEPGEELDPEFLARLREIAAPFSLRHGEVKTVELREIPHP